MYYGSYTCISEHILVLRILYWYYGYGSTHRYYRDFTEILLVFVLHNKYRGTRRYYRTDTEVPVGTFRSLPYSLLYSYSLFEVLSDNCWIA